MDIIKRAKGLIRRQELSKEALEAYYNRLPKKIAVKWFRDADYIIGGIDIDGKEYLTQAKNPDEFITMVNETVYAMYDIPREYLAYIAKIKRYSPTDEEKDRLNNLGIKSANFKIEKEKKLQLA